MEVTYKFDSEEDEHKLKLVQNVDKMYFALDTIYNLVRTQLKYEDDEISDKIEKLLEDIREEAYIVHTMEDY